MNLTKGSISVTTSQTHFLTELEAGHLGPPIPLGKRAYFQQRLRIRVFNFLLEKFIKAQSNGLNKALLAKRIGKTPDVVNRWLGQPSNLTIDTISDLLLGIAAEELELESSSPIRQVADNYAHFDDLASAQTPKIDKTNQPEDAQSSNILTITDLYSGPDIFGRPTPVGGNNKDHAPANAQDAAYARPDVKKAANA
jgi:hypothetical protein